MTIANLRNIGISAHIDSGKTTLSERILFYAGRIHKMEEVHSGGATMDHMELEQERGITITSAATSVQWNGHWINLIDTPGHVDFTVEVERSLRVLDGAVLVLCAVGGVQSQSLTVDRQMKRYHVPRIAFINKMDRVGADPQRVLRQMRDKLDTDAILMQLPLVAGDAFEGVIDLVTMQAVYFDGEHGQEVRRAAIPASLVGEAQTARQQMLEALSMYHDGLMERLLSEQEVPESLVHDVIREAVRAEELTPVLLGSAYRNKGVQLLLDAIVRYLPSPLDREVTAHPVDHERPPIRLEPSADRPLVGMAFKIVDDPFGQLTFMRIYQGTIRKGQTYLNQRTGKKERFGRIVRMHADNRQEIDEASAGDIVAVMGAEGASGDTYSSEPAFGTLERMFVPDPVLKVAISPRQRADAPRLGKALARYRREDPTFHVMTDAETSQTLIAGMGELHLDVYVERIRREYKVDVVVGPPKVSYREAPRRGVPFDHRHRKQTGGAGQYAHIIGRMEPETADPSQPFVFEDEVVGGRVPRQYIPSVEKGFRQSLAKGPVAGFPIVGVKVVLQDGSYHEVDSSDLAFQIAARDCFRKTFLKMDPVLLEPIMKLEVECPNVHQGAVTGDVASRRGMIMSTEHPTAGSVSIVAEVPLAETFGYATALRSQTQGQGTFTMELACYRPVPAKIQEQIVAELKQDALVGAKG
jgi:elongation factor G